MTSRHRTFSVVSAWDMQPVFNGTPVNHTSGSGTAHDGSCDDVTGSMGLDHAFDCINRDASGFATINGSIVGGVWNGSTITNYGHSQAWSLTSPGIIPAVPTPSVGTLAAKTNINRPDLNPLSILRDFTEIPQQLLELGKFANKAAGAGGKVTPRDLANQHLALQFGWLPFISDVKKILTTQKRVETRFKRLRHLYDNGGERRHYTFNKATLVEESTSASFAPSPFLVYTKVKKETVRTQWASVRWKLSHKPPVSPMFDEMYSQAWRVANGFTPRGLAEGAWDLLPWTWIADWFSSSSDYILGNANTIPVSMANVCSMNKLEATCTFERMPGSVSTLSGGAGVSKYSRKIRSLPGAYSFQSAMPIIGTWEVSILGSLAIQRLWR